MNYLVIRILNIADLRDAPEMDISDMLLESYFLNIKSFNLQK